MSLYSHAGSELEGIDYRVTFIHGNISIEVLTCADDVIEALENASEDVSHLNLDPTEWEVDFDVLNPAVCTCDTNPGACEFPDPR